MATNSAGGIVLIPVHDENVRAVNKNTTRLTTALKGVHGINGIMIECESSEVPRTTEIL